MKRYFEIFETNDFLVYSGGQLLSYLCACYMYCLAVYVPQKDVNYVGEIYHVTTRNLKYLEC